MKPPPDAKGATETEAAPVEADAPEQEISQEQIDAALERLEEHRQAEIAKAQHFIDWAHRDGERDGYRKGKAHAPQKGGKAKYAGYNKSKEYCENNADKRWRNGELAPPKRMAMFLEQELKRKQFQAASRVTIERWIKPYAPEAIKTRRGRPTKKK